MNFFSATWCYPFNLRIYESEIIIIISLYINFVGYERIKNAKPFSKPVKCIPGTKPYKSIEITPIEMFPFIKQCGLNTRNDKSVYE